MIHKYFLNGYYIVLDVNSGAVHVVDKLFYDMLDQVEPELPAECPQSVIDAFAKDYSEDAIRETYGEMVALKENGQLFTEDDYAQFANMMVSSPIKALCLNIAHDCNLRCEYCFAGKGDYCQGRMLMTEEVGKAAIDYLLHYSQGRHNLEVDFFGGEPTINFDVVKKVVEYARSKEKEFDKKFRFTITTNGLILNDDMMDFINREMYNVVCSVDGRKEINDRVRARVDGSGCYDAIIPHFQELIRRREASGNDENWQYYVRGTFTKYNKDFGNDVMHMFDLGFDQISFEPVVADAKQPYALTYEDLSDVFAEYERLSKLIIENKKSAGKHFNFYHFMIDLDQGPCAIKRLRGCGCGNEYVAITPDGDVYPCHQFVGHEEWKMGNVFDLSINKEMKDNFARATVYHKPKCQECWAKFYCSGGCNANNWQYMGDVLDSFDLACEMEKKRLECAIMIQAALAD